MYLQTAYIFVCIYHYCSPVVHLFKITPLEYIQESIHGGIYQQKCPQSTHNFIVTLMLLFLKFHPAVLPSSGYTHSIGRIQVNFRKKLLPSAISVEYKILKDYQIYS